MHDGTGERAADKVRRGESDCGSPPLARRWMCSGVCLGKLCVAHLLGEARREAHHVDKSSLHHSHPLRLGGRLTRRRATASRSCRARRRRLRRRGALCLRLRLRSGRPQRLCLRDRLLLRLPLLFELLGLAVKAGGMRGPQGHVLHVQGGGCGTRGPRCWAAADVRARGWGEREREWRG